MTAACSFRTRWARPRWTWPPCRASRTSKSPPRCWARCCRTSRPRSSGQCIADAYGEQWSDERITPLKPLGDDYVLELFNGPTSAFKDVALQILPRFMAHTTPADGDADEKIMILTATSGDTGKAALAGFADAPGTAITVFYPEGKVSQVQELQMTTQAGSNVQVCRRGRQLRRRPVRGQAHLRRHAPWPSVSPAIRTWCFPPPTPSTWAVWCRRSSTTSPLTRSCWHDQVINVGDEVEFVVPTGNFGDILAGYYAKLLGLPVKHLVVASDKNNVLFDFLTSGTYNRQRPFFQTISPSMDILISSNLERMLYYMSDGRHPPDLHADERPEPVGRVRGSRADC